MVLTPPGVQVLRSDAGSAAAAATLAGRKRVSARARRAAEAAVEDAAIVAFAASIPPTDVRTSRRLACLYAGPDHSRLDPRLCLPPSADIAVADLGQESAGLDRVRAAYAFNRAAPPLLLQEWGLGAGSAPPDESTPARGGLRRGVRKRVPIGTAAQQAPSGSASAARDVEQGLWFGARSHPCGPHGCMYVQASALTPFVCPQDSRC